MWWIKVGFGLVVGLVLTVLSELPLWGWEHGLIELLSVIVCLISIEIGVEMID